MHLHSAAGILTTMDAQKLAVLAANAWAAQHGCSPLVYERPDELNRRDRAVDLLGRDSDGWPRLVLEHTLVESFLDQRSKQIAAIAMFKPLERQLSGQMPAPGHYNLTLKPGAVLGLKREVRRIREWAAEWIRATAPSLAIGGPGTAPKHHVTVAIPDTALKASLYRWPRRDGQFDLVFEAPGSDDALAPSLERAIGAKCPKLASAKEANPGAASLLLLEISDIALGNLFDLDAVVQVRFSASVEDVPDHLWLVDTTDDPPSVLISKDGTRMGDALDERFLRFCFRPVKES